MQDEKIQSSRVNAKTGASKLLFTDTSDMWINLSDDLHPLKDGSILFSSERSGFRHIYRWNDGRIEPVTQGSWPVSKIVGAGPILIEPCDIVAIAEGWEGFAAAPRA